MQMIGISAAALTTQPLNSVFYVKHAKSSNSEAQAAQSTTILLAASTDSSQSRFSQNTFMYMTSSSGGITIIEEMSFSSSFSVTVGGVQSSSSFIEASSISATSSTDLAYVSATTVNYSTGEQGVNLRFNAMA
jgi:hypothetical protein